MPQVLLQPTSLHQRAGPIECRHLPPREKFRVHGSKVGKFECYKVWELSRRSANIGTFEPSNLRTAQLSSPHRITQTQQEISINAQAAVEILQPQEFVRAVQVLVGHLPGEED